MSLLSLLSLALSITAQTAHAETESPIFFRAGERIEVRTEQNAKETVEPQKSESLFDALNNLPVIEEIQETNSSDKGAEVLEGAEVIQDEKGEMRKEKEDAEVNDGQANEALSSEALAKEDSEANEANLKPSASTFSLIIHFVNRFKYAAAGLGLLAIVYMYIFKRKKVAPAPVAATDSQASAAIPKPEDPQKTEENSPRLEHALEAMEEE